jgi:hypothetical protein
MSDIGSVDYPPQSDFRLAAPITAIADRNRGGDHPGDHEADHDADHGKDHDSGPHRSDAGSAHSAAGAWHALNVVA